MIRNTTRALLAVVCLGTLLSGCAHETATTTIRQDGGWTRKSVLSMAESDGAKGAKKMTLEDVFTPPSGQGWKIERKTTGDQPKQDVLTAVKEVRAGESISGDLTVKGGGEEGTAAGACCEPCDRPLQPVRASGSTPRRFTGRA